MLVKAMSILFMEKSARSSETVILPQNAGSMSAISADLPRISDPTAIAR